MEINEGKDQAMSSRPGKKKYLKGRAVGDNRGNWPRLCA